MICKFGDRSANNKHEIEVHLQPANYPTTGLLKSTDLVTLLYVCEHGKKAVHLVRAAVVSGDVAVSVAIGHHVGRVRVNGRRGKSGRETPEHNNN